MQSSNVLQLTQVMVYKVIPFPQVVACQICIICHEVACITVGDMCFLLKKLQSVYGRPPTCSIILAVGQLYNPPNGWMSLLLWSLVSMLTKSKVSILLFFLVSLVISGSLDLMLWHHHAIHISFLQLFLIEASLVMFTIHRSRSV